MERPRTSRFWLDSRISVQNALQNLWTVLHTCWAVSQATAEAHFHYLSLYLMTASTIFLIFLVRAGGLGESFSAGGLPLFRCLFPSSSLSPLPRPPKEEEGPGRSKSRSRFLLRVVFLWRTSSSTSSSVPSSIACAGKSQSLTWSYFNHKRRTNPVLKEANELFCFSNSKICLSVMAFSPWGATA